MSPPVRQANQTQPWEDYAAVLRTAERSRAVGDLSRARTFFARLVELDPKDPRGWVGMATTAQSLDEKIISWGYALAVTADGWEARIQLDACIAERIATSGIADAPVLIALGRTLAEMGQRHSAHRLLTRATELDPTNVEGWLWRGGVSDDPSEVISCLQQVLALDPENERAKAGLTWALQKQTAVQEPVPESSEAREAYAAGQRAFQAGDLHSAHQAFQRATELDPHNDQAWFWRGSTAPNTEQALTCMEQTLKLNPQHTDAIDARWWLRVKKFRDSLPAGEPRPSPLVVPQFNPPEIKATQVSARRLYLWLLLAIVIGFAVALVVFIQSILAG